MTLDVNNIISKIKGQYDTLILFGSYSRGDSDGSSDIDIAQITNNKFESYNVGDINVSVYSTNDLNSMATKSSLFVYHLLLEGKIIKGDNNLLYNLKKRFIKPKNYFSYIEEIKFAAKVLDITSEEYKQDWKGFNSLALYLFRSFLYAKMYDDGQINFSIKHISFILSDPMILHVFKNKNINDFIFFKSLKSLFEKHIKIVFKNDYGDLNVLIEKEKENHKLMIALSLHFLNKNVIRDFY